MKFVGWLILIVTPFVSQGQSKKITSFKTTSDVVSAAIDRAGDFYVVLKSGDIHKYDKNGTLLGSYQHEGLPTLFDPSNAIRLLVYYKKGQQYSWLSPEPKLQADRSRLTLKQTNFYIVGY